MATSRSTGNYSQSAKAVIRASDQIFDAAMSGKPDFTAISKEAIKGRSLERRAVTKAEGNVAKAGIEAFTEANLYKMKADTDKKVADIKRPAKRMAGIVGGLGTIAGAAVMNKMNKDAAADRALDRADQQAYWARQTEMMQDMKTENQNLIDALKASNTPAPTPSPSSSTTGTTPAPAPTPTPTPTPSPSGAKPTTVSQDISAQHSFDPTKKMTKAQIKQLAESVGFNPQAAATVVGIAGGESGFDPTNSTRRSGLYARTGEDSVGLMQINWGYHKDSGWLQGLGIHSREDLFDPVKNMKAAKYLYDGRKGNFGDWTVYNKGIYQNYL